MLYAALLKWLAREREPVPSDLTRTYWDASFSVGMRSWTATTRSFSTSATVWRTLPMGMAPHPTQRFTASSRS